MNDYVDEIINVKRSLDRAHVDIECSKMVLRLTKNQARTLGISLLNAAVTIGELDDEIQA